MNPADFVQENRFELYRGEQMKGRVYLEKQVSDKGKRDAILFPDLQKIHTYKGSSPWITELTFPEKLLNKEKNWKNYEIEVLSPKHPLFAKLHYYILTIEKYLSDPKAQPIASSLLNIQRYYQRYIQECCLAEGKQRRLLLKDLPACLAFCKERRYAKRWIRKSQDALFRSIALMKKREPMHLAPAPFLGMKKGMFFIKEHIKILYTPAKKLPLMPLIPSF